MKQCKKSKNYHPPHPERDSVRSFFEKKVTVTKMPIDKLHTVEVYAAYKRAKAPKRTKLSVDGFARMAPRWYRESVRPVRIDGECRRGVVGAQLNT